MSFADSSTQSDLYRKVYTRLMPILFVMGVCAFLDRVNIGFAGPTMRDGLNLSATVFGFANSLFYIGFVLFEIPSNLILARVGARVWLTRIMVTWGLVSAATMLTVGPNSLYVTRLLLGICEAGFVPGVVLYLSFWIPLSLRARATGLFILAQPLTLAVGAFASGFLLKMDGVWALRGWQWLFLIEGLLSVVVGITAYFILDDHPSKASWLKEGEKRELIRMTGSAKQDYAEAELVTWTKRIRGFLTFDVFRFGFVYFTLTSSLSPSSLWTPQIVQAFRGKMDTTLLGILSAVPASVAVIATVYVSRSSDLREERRYHVAVPMLAAAMGWLITGYVHDSTVQLIGLSAAVAGSFSALGVFWTMPGRVLPPAARAGGLALAASLGMLGSTISPTVIGYLKDLTGTFSSGLLATTGILLCGIAAYLTSPTGPRPTTDPAQDIEMRVAAEA